MNLKDQFSKIKDNWLIILVVLVLILFLNKIPVSYNPLSKVDNTESLDVSAGYDSGRFIDGSESFYPDIEDRLITKTVYLSSEVGYGEFFKSETDLKNIASRYEVLILNENTYKTGPQSRQTNVGNYMIKVESEKYDSFIEEVKNIGEIESFNEQAEDITGSVKDLEIELSAEKERLTRYKNLLTEAKSVEEKIRLTDLIFDLERRISYIEESLQNQELRVQYSTVQVTLQEKESAFANATLTSLSRIIGAFVESINSIILLIAKIIPYAIAVFIIWLIVKALRKR